jgi:hypothetical protein
VFYFSFLQLALYAQSATTSPSAGTKSISEDYIAFSANWEEIQKDSLISDFTKVWLHLVLVLFPLLTWLMLYLCDPVNLLLGDKTWQKLDDEHSHPVIAALIQISALFTFFIFVLDWVAFAQTLRGEFLAYDRNAAFYLSAATGLLVDCGAFGWVVYVLISICHWDLKHFWQYWKGETTARKECPEHIKKLMYTIMVAPILCVANHLHYIILAFISDPFHAGFIVIGYLITFFLFYFIFRQVYGRVVLRSNRLQAAWEKEKIVVNVATSQIDIRYRLAQVAKEKGDEEAYQMFTESGMEPKPVKVKPRRRVLRVPFNTQVVVFGLILIGPVLVLYEFIFITIFVSLPISKSLEAVPASLYSIYGTGIIIVALLTYNIVLNPSPFSLPKAAERIGKDLRLPRRYVNWHKFTDEEKFATLVTYLLRHREDLAPSPEPEYSSGEGTDNDDVRLLEERERSEVVGENDQRSADGLVHRKRNDSDSQLREGGGAVPPQKVSSANQVITLNAETSV